MYFMRLCILLCLCQELYSYSYNVLCKILLSKEILYLKMDVTTLMTHIS